MPTALWKNLARNPAPLTETRWFSTLSTAPTTTTVEDSMTEREEGPPPGTEDRSRAREALSPLNLTGEARVEAWRAWKESPDGTERVAYEAMSGDVPPALFLHKVRAGHHLLPAHEPVRRPTGWRFVRGHGGGTYVRDPKGVDRLPEGYDLQTYAHPPLHGGPDRETADRTAEIEVPKLNPAHWLSKARQAFDRHRGQDDHDE